MAVMVLLMVNVGDDSQDNNDFQVNYGRCLQVQLAPLVRMVSLVARVLVDQLEQLASLVPLDLRVCFVQFMLLVFQQLLFRC